MCTNFTPATPHHLLPMTGLGAVDWPVGDWPEQAFPGHLAPILTAPANGCEGLQGRLARFGLIPHWCRDAAHANTVARGTYNARCETVVQKPSFRRAWRERRFALVPMLNYFEPCWESGRAVRWRIGRADGRPLLAAALHGCWTDPEKGEAVHSFSLLTTNADGHPLLNRMYRPDNEKRQLRLMDPSDGRIWLRQPVDEALGWLDSLPDVTLVGQAAPLRPDPQGALPF